MTSDTVVLPRHDFDRLARFTGLTYVLLEQLERLVPLIDPDHPDRTAAEKTIELSRKALAGVTGPPSDASPLGNT
jgi:hypothetical protein